MKSPVAGRTQAGSTQIRRGLLSPATLPAPVPFELPRPRLRRRTISGVQTGVTLVRAPAGYGKTVLLRQWFEEALTQGGQAVWLDAKFERGAQLHHRLAELTGGLEACSSLLILIDHVDGIAGMGGCLQALQLLLDRAGRGVHCVLASRGETGLHLGRLYVNGVCEVGPDELRFTSEETLELLQTGDCAAARDDETRLLIERAEGWPAALHLLRSVLYEKAGRLPGAATLASVTARLGIFFAEEGLAGQPALLRNFLRRTSILEVLDADACDVVADMTGSHALLDECERRGLFVRSVDPARARFRCHPLLRDYLRSELRQGSPDEERGLRMRASHWFLSAGDYEQAYDHAIGAGEYLEGARILDACCADRRSEGLGRRLLSMMERLPQELRSRYPRVLLAMAWTLIFWWDFDQAEEVLIACRNRLNQIRSTGAAAPEQLEELENLYLHRQMMLALFQDDLPRVVELCDHLIRQYVLATPLVKASFFMSMIQAQTDRYRLRDADVLAARARKALERSLHPLPLIPLISAMARVRLTGGMDRETIESLIEQLAAAERCETADAHAAAAMVAIPLAEIHYERNELDQAAELLKRHLPGSPGHSFLDCWISGRLLRSRLLRLGDDLAGSLAALDVEPAWAPAGGLERLRQFFAVERIGLLLQAGRPEEALRVGREARVDGEIRDLLPAAGGASTCKEARAMSFVRLAEVQGRIAEALKVCAHWRALLGSAGAVRNLVRWEVLTASLLLGDGQSRPAQRHLRAAIAAAAPGRYLRSILDEGQRIGELLLDNPNLACGHDEAGNRFGCELIAAFERELNRTAAVPADAIAVAAAGQHARPPNSNMNAREIEMLRMIAAGLLNRELAERLAITEGTVKWYLHQIYEKLGVNRRTLAVRRARELGLV